MYALIPTHSQCQCFRITYFQKSVRNVTISLSCEIMISGDVIHVILKTITVNAIELKLDL